MPTPKVVHLVTSCGECPNYNYDSGGVHQCSLVSEIVNDRTAIAPFCPLPDFPSRTIAGMQATIIGLREPNKHVFGTALLTHVATKLDLNLANSAGITISFMDGEHEREVHLAIDCITDVKVWPFEIRFTSGASAFSLSPDANPPLLREATDTDGESWRHHELRQ